MSTSTGLPLLLITGVTGYIGAHVLREALEAGYPVRATARPSKVEALHKQFNGKVEVVGIEDIAKGDYTDALKGVGAVVHVAAPLPGRADAAGMIEGAVSGSLSILKQAATAGIKKIIVTSSFVTSLDFNRAGEVYEDIVIDENKWAPVTREEILQGEHDPFWIYAAVKTEAEREIWRFADQHPDLDITTINPSFVYGPLAPSAIVPKGDIGALSTLGIFVMNVLPLDPSVTISYDKQGTGPMCVDVRDVARMHIIALQKPPAGKHKRILCIGPGFTWAEAVEHLRVVKPQLSDRLPQVDKTTVKRKTATFDRSSAEKILGFTEYIDWKKTVEDSADSFTELQQRWARE